MNELDRLGWAVQHTFDIGGSPVGIRTTSQAFGEWLGSALAAHRVDGEGPLRYSIVAPDRSARRRREYDILYRGCGALVRTLNRRTLVESLLSELEAWSFRERDDAVFLRMAPIAAHGAVALVPPYVANAIIGLGRRAERVGITLPAQLHVAVDRGTGAMIPIRRTLEVDPTALEAIEDDGRADRFAVLEETAPDGLLFFAESGDAVTQVSRGVALYRVAGSAFNLPEVGGDGLRSLGRLVAGARCRAVNVVEPADILDAVSQAMHEMAGG
jgi:hypothetical protein